MISKVRLQRKFNPRSKFDYQQHVMLIIRIQIVFQLLIILLTCLFNLSLDFHLGQIFTCQFWTNPQVIHYNMAMLVTCIVYCPYLILLQKVKVTLVKDCYFTVLLIHTVCGLVQNFDVEADYLVFVVTVGGVMAVGTQYLAMVLEQKKLIDQINEIESEDRKQMRFEENQFAGLTTFQLGDAR